MPDLNKTQRIFLAAVGGVIFLIQLYRFGDEGVSGDSWIFALPIAAILCLPALSKLSLPIRAESYREPSSEEAIAGVAEETEQSDVPSGRFWRFFLGLWIMFSCVLLLIGFYTLLPDAGASTVSINTVLAIPPVLSRFLRFVLYSVGLVFLFRSSPRKRVAWVWILALTIPLIVWQLMGDVRYELIAQEPAEAAREARSDSIAAGLHLDSVGPFDFGSISRESPVDSATQIALQNRLERSKGMPSRLSTNPAGSLPLSRFSLEVIAIGELLLSLGFLVAWVRVRHGFPDNVSADSA